MLRPLLLLQHFLRLQSSRRPFARRQSPRVLLLQKTLLCPALYQERKRLCRMEMTASRSCDWALCFSLQHSFTTAGVFGSPPLGTKKQTSSKSGSYKKSRARYWFARRELFEQHPSSSQTAHEYQRLTLVLCQGFVSVVAATAAVLPVISGGEP